MLHVSQSVTQSLSQSLNESVIESISESVDQQHGRKVERGERHGAIQTGKKRDKRKVKNSRLGKEMMFLCETGFRLNRKRAITIGERERERWRERGDRERGERKRERQ